MNTRLLCAALLSAVALLAAAASGVSAAATGEPAATSRAQATVWAIGDAYPSQAGRELAALVRRARPDLFLYLGDVYETGTAAEFVTGYDALYGDLATRTLATIGNHEYGNRATGYQPYWTRKLGKPMPDWTKRRIAGWEILMLNSEAPHADGSAQVRWLRRAVRKRGTCRIAITHRPRFSASSHGDQQDMEPLWGALRGRVRLLLSGHDHDLQRFADKYGTRQLVSGGGGRPGRTAVTTSAAPIRFFHDASVGALRLRLSPGRAQIDFVDARGRLLDRSHARCERLRG